MGIIPLTNGILPIIFRAMTREELLIEIAEFLSRTDVRMTESTFGRFAVNDGKLVPRLRKGGGLTLETAEKIRSFIRNYRPQVAPVAPSESQPGAAA